MQVMKLAAESTGLIHAFTEVLPGGDLEQAAQILLESGGKRAAHAG